MGICIYMDRTSRPISAEQEKVHKTQGVKIVYTTKVFTKKRGVLYQRYVFVLLYFVILEMFLLGNN